ncbi:MAG: polyribonucleotide nucleotidyltransferase [Candidatus Kuenenbacteria bacterium]
MFEYKKSDSNNFELELDKKNLIIKIGEFANQANGSCTIQCGGTVILATAVMSKKTREGIDFFPLVVDFEEKFYAAGKMKGSRFIKREGRASDEAILSSRLIDRAIRPLFNDQMKNDVQIVLTVLSFDKINDPDVLSLIAASIALSVSDIPWDGPVAGIRVGKINEEWIINPSYEDREKSNLDVVVAGACNRVTMLEAGAEEAKEEQIISAIKVGQEYLLKINNLIQEIQEKIGKDKNLEILNESEEKKIEREELKQITLKFLNKELEKNLFDQKKETKEGRKETISFLKEKLDKELEIQEVSKEKRSKISEMMQKMIEIEISKMILEKNKRVDNRKLTEIRPLEAKAGILSFTHGSGLFRRGQTEILSVVTLGAPGAEQFIDTMEIEGRKRFMHHYNFPPFSVGEISPLRGPGRRDIGHGALAEKALLPLIPNKEEFPYTIRIVSEVLGSNGSSSMGSVCGSSLALMDAGIPIKKAVAGIAMGLASEEKNGEIKKFKIITDLQDLEDGKGGMDFKIAGTKDGITAIQMDTKSHGITQEIIEKTFSQALKARLEILEVMNKSINFSRLDLSPLAPRVVSIKINPDKIRDVIGSGGKIINEIIKETGATIDIEDDGTIFVASPNKESIEKAIKWIETLTHEIEVGEVFQGKVTRILTFGAFVEVLPKQEGLVHISELASYRVARVEDVVNIGDVIKVEVIGIDEQGRINLSHKRMMEKR